MDNLLYKSPAGHKVYKMKNNIIINYNKKMLSLSTSQLNGGFWEVDTSFNNRLTEWIEHVDDLPGGSLKEYFRLKAIELGLDWERTTGLITTASMDNVAINYESYKDISLFTVITAGVDSNAVRAGDPAVYYESKNREFIMLGGTINIMLVLEFNLPPENMLRTSIIVTEAKSAALQDMNIKSCFSNKIATGTGTDGLIITCHKSSDITFSDVGNHSKVGELISKSVKSGVMEAIKKDRSNGGA